MFKEPVIESKIRRASQEDVFEFDISVEWCRVCFDKEKLRRPCRDQEI
jgi:hypothetical protein